MEHVSAKNYVSSGTVHRVQNYRTRTNHKRKILMRQPPSSLLSPDSCMLTPCSYNPSNRYFVIFVQSPWSACRYADWYIL